jgi:hypothetical protein
MSFLTHQSQKLIDTSCFKPTASFTFSDYNEMLSSSISDCDFEEITLSVEKEDELWKLGGAALHDFHKKQLDDLLREQQRQYNLYLEQLDKLHQHQQNTPLLITEERHGNIITLETLSSQIYKKINDIGNKQFGILIWSKNKYNAYAVTIKNVVSKSEEYTNLHGKRITEYRTLSFLDLNYAFSEEKNELLCWDKCRCGGVHRNIFLKKKKFENNFFTFFIPEICLGSNIFYIPRNTFRTIN